MAIIETPEVTLPSSPADQEKIRRVLQTISDSLTRIESERELIKDEVDALAEEYDLKKKYINKLARTFHRQNYDEQAVEHEQFSRMYEELMMTKKG